MIPAPDIEAIVKAEIDSVERAEVQKPDWRPIAADPQLAAAIASELDDLESEAE